jgi:hypothetical protein
MSRKKTKWTDQEIGWLERRQASVEEYWHEIEQMEGEELWDYLEDMSGQEFMAFMAKFYAAKLAGRVSDGVLDRVRLHMTTWRRAIFPILAMAPKIRAIMERRRAWSTEDAMGVGR